MHKLDEFSHSYPKKLAVFQIVVTNTRHPKLKTTAISCLESSDLPERFSYCCADKELVNVQSGPKIKFRKLNNGF